MYRVEDPRPDRICIVCYRTVGLGASTCGDCGAPLVPLDTPEVVAELRRRAKVRKDGPKKRRELVLSIVAFVLSLVVFTLLVVAGVYDLGKHMDNSTTPGDLIELWPLILLFLGFAWILTKLTDALGLFRPLPGSDAFDPETADVPALLEWLGLTDTNPPEEWRE